MSECPYCQNSFEMTEICHDEFRMWQGLVGPYYTPSVDEDGILSWTNTGGLPNPDPIDISGPAGSSFSIEGIVATVSALPQGGSEGVWLVGTEAPYEGYSFVSGAWADIGQLAIGPRGEQGEPGEPGQDGSDGISAGFGTPTATITNTTGTPSVTITASGPDTAKVFAFAFANLKGAKGDTGSKGDPGEVTQAEFDALADDVDELKTNIIQSDAKTISANGTTTYTLTGLTADHVVGNWGMFSDSGLSTPIPENAPTCDITITTSANSWSVTVANFSSTFYLKPTFIKD